MYYIRSSDDHSYYQYMKDGMEWKHWHWHAGPGWTGLLIRQTGLLWAVFKKTLMDQPGPIFSGLTGPDIFGLCRALVWMPYMFTCVDSF